MFTSSRYSYLALRLGLAAVFLWFGVDKFRQPEFWASAWLSPGILFFIGHFGLTGMRFVYINGVFEVLAGLSMLLGVFTRLFAILIVTFLFLVLVFNGINQATVRDFGLIGAALAILFWPPIRSRF